MIDITLCPKWSEACEQAAVLVQSSPAAPLDSDLVLVPSTAHKRWFSQYLATRTDGPHISAGIDIVPWRSFVNGFLKDSWNNETLTLAICDALASTAEDEIAEMSPVRRYLGGPAEHPGRRYAAAARFARLFQRYGWQCPDMLIAWSQGTNTDPSGDQLHEDRLWQPILWRAVRNSIPVDPVELYQDALEKLHHRADPDLPQRILGVLLDDPDESSGHLLQALSAHHELHLFTVAGIPEQDATGSAFLRHHSSRSSQGAAVCEEAPFPETLLHQVQHEMHHDHAPHYRTRADSSFQIHAAHGAARQVEVLRDILCGVFADIPDLQPRDVVVLCTDLAEYAPLIEASFCLGSRPGFHPGHGLRVQVASASMPTANPILGMLFELIQLYLGRATSVDLIDFCQLPAVARRFRFDTDRIRRLRELVTDSEISWGVDTDQRSRNGLGVFQSTWFAGVQRLLVSLALASEPPVALGTSAPLAGVQGSDAELIGELAELVSRVRKITHEFAAEASAAQWALRLREAVDLLGSVSFEDSWQLNHALSVLADFADHTHPDTMLDISDIAGWLGSKMNVAGRRPNYGNGSLIVTDLNDLAGIEARVICVLGLDDAHFPGSAALDGDDLLCSPSSISYRHWTCDQRAVRRQRLLDAILSAQDRFIVVTQGAEQSTGALRPVPVCIAEIMDACAIQGPAGSWACDEPTDIPPSHRLVHWHPLHPHGWQDFAVGCEGPASFDQQGLRGAQSLQQPPAPPAPTWSLLHTTSASEHSPELSIAELISFFVNPARSLLKTATGITRSSFTKELRTELPIAPDGLDQWAIGNALFSSLSAGYDTQQALNNLRLSGKILVERSGEEILDEQLAKAQPIAELVNSANRGRKTWIDCRVRIDDRWIQGRIQLLDNTVVLSRFGHCKPDDALVCWLRLLLISASEQMADVEGLIIAKKCYRLTPPSCGEAQEILGWLANTRDSGLSQVLPLPLRTAAAYSNVLTWEKGDPLKRARDAYQKEDENWTYFFPTFDHLVNSQPARFAELSTELFSRIQDHLSPTQHPLSGSRP